MNLKVKEPRITKQFFDNIWDKKDSGFYVEIGAWEGTKKNSTVILELAGWKGVCIEASPLSYKKLEQNRKCKCLNVAVYDYDGEIDYALFPDRPEWNGIVETYNDQHKKLLESKNPRLGSRTSAQAEIVKIKCRRWNSLNLPTHIDYMQLDVEGAEIAILNNIDWSTQHIDYICLEDNDNDGTYQQYMTSLGYEPILKQKVDVLWKKI